MLGCFCFFMGNWAREGVTVDWKEKVRGIDREKGCHGRLEKKSESNRPRERLSRSIGKKK